MNTYQLLSELFRSKIVENQQENVLHDLFYEQIIYNGPPETRSDAPIFRLLAANMGTEYAIIWALDLCGTKLLKYIDNPSHKVITKAISIDVDLYDQYKDKLTENDLITIVQMTGSGLFPPKGWRLLRKLDPQPLSIIKAALDVDPEAIIVVKNQTPEICEYCVLNNNFNYRYMEHIKVRTEKIETKILENVTNGKWSLQWLNKKLITRELLEKFLVQDYDFSLQYVVGSRDDLVDAALVELATTNPKSSNFPYVPDHFKTLEMCRKQIAIHPHYLAYIPNKYQLHDIVGTAIVKDPTVYEHIKNEHVTPELAKLIYAVNNSTKRKRFDFINNCTEDEIMVLLKYYPRMYRVLRDNLKTFKITKHAVTLDRWNLEYVPDAHYNDEIYNLALTSQPAAIKHKRH